MWKAARAQRGRAKLHRAASFAYLTGVLCFTAGPRLAAADTPPPSAAESSTGDAGPPEPRAPRALLTGMLIAGGSLGVGSWLVAGSDDLRQIHAGLAIGGAGLSLAPLFAHGVAGEWQRGAWFSLPPAVASAGMLALVRAVPEAPLRGKRKSHSALLFPVLVGLNVVASGVGIVDAALVDERRGTALRLTAAAAPGFTGLRLGGDF
jgi:hypothetical protein